MSDPTPTSDEQRLATANVFKNIAGLIRKGLFFGENAGYVQEALGFLDRSAAAMSAEASPPPTTPAPALAAVPPLPKKKKGKTHG